MKIGTPLLYGIVISSLIILAVFFAVNIDRTPATCSNIPEPEAEGGTGEMPTELVSSILPLLEGNVEACFNYNGQIYVLSSGDLYEYAPAMFMPGKILPMDIEHGVAGSFAHDNTLYILDGNGDLYPYNLQYFSEGIVEADGKPIKTGLINISGVSAHLDYVYIINTDGQLIKYYIPELLCGKTIPRSRFDLANDAKYAKKLSCFTLTDYIAFLMSGHRYHEYLVGEFSRI